MSLESAEPEEQVRDGRRRKGVRRRRLLLAATMRVIERHGIAAVSQRAVAEEAQLPASAVTYYFPTVDSLLVATLTACNDAYVRRLESFAGDGLRALRQLAELIAESGTAHRAQVAAEYELYLQAARRADLRAELARWTRALDAFFAGYLDDPLARVGVTAAVDGLFIRCFCAEDPPGADEILDVLNRLTHRAP